MKIKLLHAVLHDGHRIEAGQTGEVEDDLALTLIASGAAVVVEEPPVARTSGGNDASKELEPLIQPDTGQPAASPAAPTAPKEAEAETAKKADKAKEGK